KILFLFGIGILVLGIEGCGLMAPSEPAASLPEVSPGPAEIWVNSVTFGRSEFNFNQVNAYITIISRNLVEIKAKIKQGDKETSYALHKNKVAGQYYYIFEFPRLGRYAVMTFDSSYQGKQDRLLLFLDNESLEVLDKDRYLHKMQVD
ncbi:MAG: hypothetical protein HY602_00315, partial [Parcubacteria group bacterium]|nr:hypothetical protein [Parcubacteria group bacterium]